jgi:hypothetical protein
VASYDNEAAAREGLPDVGAEPLSTMETGGWLCFAGEHSAQRVINIGDTYVCEACLFDLVRDGRLRVGVPRGSAASTDAELVDGGSVVMGDIAFSWS